MDIDEAQCIIANLIAKVCCFTYGHVILSHNSRVSIRIAFGDTYHINTRNL